MMRIHDMKGTGGCLTGVWCGIWASSASGAIWPYKIPRLIE
jgi:hypothetical protein